MHEADIQYNTGPAGLQILTQIILIFSFSQCALHSALLCLHAEMLWSMTT